jgi:hypothetical protein
VNLLISIVCKVYINFHIVIKIYDYIINPTQWTYGIIENYILINEIVYYLELTRVHINFNPNSIFLYLFDILKTHLSSMSFVN